MYLSRVEIDVNNRQKMKELNHLGAYHNWIEKLFPAEIANERHSRKLWRIDKLQNRHYLILVSKEKPDLKKMEWYGVENSAQSKDYDAFLNQLYNGQVLRFKATLNPVMSISTGKLSGKRGRVVPHITVAHQMDYLKERSAKNGFGLKDEEFYITESEFAVLKKEGTKPIRINKVTYEGQLTITDVETFREVLMNGLGKKKAYGCGMITVIPSKQ